MKTKLFRFNGKKYTRQEICKLFGMSESNAYLIMKQHNCRLQDVFLFSHIKSVKLRGYIIRGQQEVITETSEFEVLNSIKFNPEICSNFGCNKILTHTEKLFGSKCISCQNENIKIIGKHGISK